MIRIKVIIPNSGMDSETLRDRERMLSAYVSGECSISVECISEGPESIESNTDEGLAARPLMKQALAAQADGFDAVVVYCGSDVCVNALREILDIPVIGPGSVTIAAASMLSVRFTVVTTASKNVPRTERRLMEDPVCREKMIAVRPINIPVTELRNDPEVTMRCLEELCKRAIEEDKVDTLVLSCLGFASYGKRLEDKYDITVLDPSSLCVAWAEVCARNKIIHHRRAYPRFTVKENEL